jgi:crossover junction endodeoxyribonuclease RuvC
VLILGIDPGLGTTGYGIIDDRNFRVVEAGVIRTRPNIPVQERIGRIFEDISSLIKEYEPSVMVLEKIYSHYKHPTTAILMGHARAMACLVCGKYDLRLVNYPSTRIKKVITGNGHASKAQVAHMVKDILGLRKLPEPADVSDALAMAVSYCYIENRMPAVSRKP